MTIACDCGAFKATLKSFPRNTPGRLACYCESCQQFARRLGREDVLDDWGGTEVIPAWPSEFVFDQGAEHLKCYRLTENGLLRWATSCCNTPIVNIRPGLPWGGVFHIAYTNANPQALESLGEIRSRIYGNSARPGAPFRISAGIGFRDALVVAPFMLKGKLRQQHRHSPFFKADDLTPIVVPELLGPKPE